MGLDFPNWPPCYIHWDYKLKDETIKSSGKGAVHRWTEQMTCSQSDFLQPESPPVGTRREPASSGQVWEPKVTKFLHEKKILPVLVVSPSTTVSQLRNKFSFCWRVHVCVGAEVSATGSFKAAERTFRSLPPSLNEIFCSSVPALDACILPLKKRCWMQESERTKD